MALRFNRDNGEFEMVPQGIGRPSYKGDFDTIDRQGRSLGRLSMIRDTLAEINRRTANMAPNSFSLKSLLSLAEWLGEQAERERP